MAERTVAVGIDLSATRAATVVFCDREAQVPSIADLADHKVALGDYGRRIRRAWLLAKRTSECLALDVWPEAVIAIESLSAGRGVAGQAATEAMTLLLCRLEELGAKHWFLVHPAHLKMFAGCKGNASKTEVGYAVRHRWGFDDPSDDVVDAYVLARMADATVGEDGLTVAQKTVLSRCFIVGKKRKNLQFQRDRDEAST
jgi:crossover junction endodeoxyribonuclease RuvC